MHFVVLTPLLAMDTADQTVGVMTRIAVTAVTTIALDPKRAAPMTQPAITTQRPPWMTGPANISRVRY